ncbi:MAG: hypothetical protein P4M04_04435 [Acidobacteriota bacterium]|nr:hypothetical protein [Acidobacteriota bacterium]
MGRELLCSVRTGGKTAHGKALLETSEILFRGDLRLKIPFASLKSVLARDGELHLKWSNGSAAFALGEQAETWAHKILHPKSTEEKLGIKPGLVVSAIAMGDGDFVDDLRAKAKSFSDAKALKGSDLIFFGAQTAAELSQVKKLAPSLASAGALWIVYPKGKQEIKESDVFAAGKAAGLVDVKVVRFSETHTALKLVIPTAKR